MQIKIIAAGSSKWERFIYRWGVSFLAGEDVLFDTFGDPGVFLHNLRKFSIDTAKVKHIVLSHDDWDHIAGLWYMLDKRKDISVYICPGFQQEIKDRIVSLGVRLIEAQGILRIHDGIYTTGELYGKSWDRKIYEQSLVIETGEGLALLCGCAHPGVVNIVRHAKDNFHREVHWLIGGFHMKDNTRETNQRLIGDLRGLGVRKIAPMHCTGKQAVEAMRLAWGKDFRLVKEGEEIEV
jgi:7,8-dihydropterin-6-yl-methyl-4-(beta-D-ribofuranosyl)aminobenzene 5'-phosphate synthase